jgi:hypothetical protein
MSPIIEVQRVLVVVGFPLFLWLCAVPPPKEKEKKEEFFLFLEKRNSQSQKGTSPVDSSHAHTG